MQLTKWNPFGEMDQYFRRMSPLFNGNFPSALDENGDSVMAWSPSADITETKKEYLIKAELPEVVKSDIHVSVNNGALTIEGERKHKKEEEDETIHRLESYHGRFMRSFALPDNVDVKKIKAESKRGVLRVHLPKTKGSAPQSPVEIDIQ